MTEAEFVPRLTRPEAGNKYYIRKKDGGWSGAVQGSPTDPECNVLSNCVGYAVGRFNEIGGWGSCKYLLPVNAELFMRYKGKCETGMTPRVGACMVWQKGPTLSGSDGAGHVAIVEKVISETEVVTSESEWGNKKPFMVKTRKKGSGRWGMGTSFEFLGFIYNPAISQSEDVTESMTREELEAFVTGIVDKAIADAMPVYGTIQDVPVWYKPTIQKLVDKGIIQGTDGAGEVLNKDDTYCQCMTTLDNAGVFGE